MTPDAGDQAKGAEDAVPPTAPGDSGDAGQDTGESPKLDAQKIHDSAYAEARRLFESELKERDERVAKLEAELGSLRDGRQKKKDEADAKAKDLEAQLDEIRASHQRKERELQERIDQAGAVLARGKLIEALAAQNVADPDYHAEMLLRRVQGDVTTGEVRVLTDAGGKALNKESGEPMSLVDLAAEFAARHPRFVLDASKPGAGYTGSATLRPKSRDQAIAEAAARGEHDKALALMIEK